MKIIKEGKIPDFKKTFACEYCGCIFEADKGEYDFTPPLGVMHDELPSYTAQCPCCNDDCYAD